MYKDDPKRTVRIIDTPVTIWGIHSTPLTFAYENFMYEFIATPASQKFLNGIWYSNQAPDIIPFIMVSV